MGDAIKVGAFVEKPVTFTAWKVAGHPRQLGDGTPGAPLQIDTGEAGVIEHAYTDDMIVQSTPDARGRTLSVMSPTDFAARFDAYTGTDAPDVSLAPEATTTAAPAEVAPSEPWTPAQG